MGFPAACPAKTYNIVLFSPAFVVKVNTSGHIKNGNLTSGYLGLTGEISDIKYINRAMSAEELMIEYTSTSDTRGRPYIDGGSILDIFGCPAGILCFKPKTPPSQGLLSWETPFS